ncbi:MAG TPA: Hsp20/alpha crystallin family protein [Candidatus Marinimicrobia bacterium]|nr:Hsp20/alpha crystallin family protein [Candidatus Neomarinimicrobiota bacterium]HRS52294.1 Hsp20/alpha crystallin family protein [Candidatus Neomarinimicrobiota bacterium]HRU92032.1 Hsp20/alpha crystallin family protein [Candidatus Neomarinimicrobiota bacterium]
MAITKTTPKSTLTKNPYAIDRFFDPFFFDRDEETSLVAFAPEVDIEEKDTEYIVNVELPGVKKDDVKISLKDNVLTISGEKKRVKKINKKNFYQCERVFGSFERSFRLPELVDQEKIAAEFKNGVLNIVIPKSPESKPKSIEIK